VFMCGAAIVGSLACTLSRLFSTVLLREIKRNAVRLLVDAATAPATVSGETFVECHWEARFREGDKRLRPASQETCRQSWSHAKDVRRAIQTYPTSIVRHRNVVSTRANRVARFVLATIFSPLPSRAGSKFLRTFGISPFQRRYSPEHSPRRKCRMARMTRGGRHGRATIRASNPCVLIAEATDAAGGIQDNPLHCRRAIKAADVLIGQIRRVNEP
jgi:hypothetical protein